MDSKQRQSECKHESLEITALNQLGVIYWNDPAIDDEWGEETYTDGYLAVYAECRGCGKFFNQAELQKMGIPIAHPAMVARFVGFTDTGKPCPVCGTTKDLPTVLIALAKDLGKEKEANPNKAYVNVQAVQFHAQCLELLYDEDKGFVYQIVDSDKWETMRKKGDTNGEQDTTQDA